MSMCWHKSIFLRAPPFKKSYLNFPIWSFQVYIIVKWRLLNLQWHFTRKSTYINITKRFSAACQSLSFDCLKIRHDEEHLLLFPSFVTRPEGRRDRRSYTCALGGGWFAAPPCNFVFCVRKTSPRRVRRRREGATGCFVVKLQNWLLRTKVGAALRIRAASFQPNMSVPPTFLREFGELLYFLNNYHQACWHYNVIM